MSRISVYMLGSALACVLVFTTPASAQLVPNLGLPGVTETLAPVVEAVAPVVETVLGPQAPLADVVYVSTNDGNPSVTVLGGESPISLDTGSSVGVDLPVVTINLPDTASLPDLPVELPGLPQLPDITNNNPGGGDIINNYPPGDPGYGDHHRRQRQPGPPGWRHHTTAAPAATRSSGTATIAAARTRASPAAMASWPSCSPFSRIAAG